MKSSIEILQNLYEVINVASLTNLINGEILLGITPNGNQKENISINTLNNSNKYLQSGYINLNIHLKSEKSGVPNVNKFKQIVTEVINLVKDVKKDTFTFQIDDDKGIFKDEDTDSMYFYNIKIKFQTL